MKYWVKNQLPLGRDLCKSDGQDFVFFGKMPHVDIMDLAIDDMLYYFWSIS